MYLTIKQLIFLFPASLAVMTVILMLLSRAEERRRAAKRARRTGENAEEAQKKVGFCSLEFSKRMLFLYVGISIILIAITIIGTLMGKDVTAIAALAGTSLIVDGTWGGFYLWKSKNENRAKYAQKFVMMFAEKYGIDAAIRIAEVVLKD